MKQDTVQSNSEYDAIVIGSGIGGMATASILSRLSKKKVLVLEKHFEMGGMTHVFSRGRFKWEVGVHYIGRMVPGLVQRTMFDYITNQRLKWVAMPAPFERFIYPSVSFGVPTDMGEYRRALIEKFPDSKTVIKRYFRDVNRAAAWFVRQYLAAFVPKPLAAILNGINALTRERPLLTTRAYMDRYVQDKDLANLLCSQWGDYGVTPDESAFSIHAVVTKHYGHGGFFPDGNTGRIASSIENVIESSGGAVLTNRHVQEVLLEDGRAVGVRVLDTRNPDNPVEQRFYAKTIISNVGASQTFERLVDTPATADLREYVGQLDRGHGAVAVYLGFKDTPEKLGVSGENFWINEVDEHLTVPQQTENLLKGSPNMCYLSFPSLRMGTVKRHTASIISIVSYAPFEKWREQPWRNRDADYYKLKEDIAESLISLAEKHVPGLRDLIEYVEVSTPLSLEHFGNREGGFIYGLKNTPDLAQRRRFRPKTPVPGLYLSGTDVCSLGVTGAMMGGLAAASAVEGPLGLFKIIGRAKRAARRPSVRQLGMEPKTVEYSYAASTDKVVAELIGKTQLTETVFEFVYRLPRDVPFRAGQYARILYSELDYGSYSIAGADGREIRFLIDTQFGGLYQDYFEGIEPGDVSTIRLPIGDLVLKDSTNDKVFVATGTGIAPLLPMMDQLAEEGFTGGVHVYFGARTQKHIFIDRYTEPLSKRLSLNVHTCLDEEECEEHHFGRVTDLLPQLKSNFSKCDFYVAGNPYMVTAVVDLLREKGAPNIYSENY